MNRPTSALANFSTLRVPIITVVYDAALQTMKLVEVALTVNGDDLWSYQWLLTNNPAFQNGPVFTIPLDTLRARLPR